MKLSSLLGHAAQLIHIIRQSSRPADNLVSEYCRQRKYLGARERRFISALVFASLRAYSLAAHCGLASSGREARAQPPAEAKQAGRRRARDRHKEPTAENLMLVASMCLLGNRASVFAADEELQRVTRAADRLEVESLVCAALAERLDWNDEESRRWAEDCIDRWQTLDAEAEEILRRPSASAENLKLLATRFCIQSWTLATWCDFMSPTHSRASAEAADETKDRLPEASADMTSLRAACMRAQALLAAAPLVLRVNTRQTSRDEVARALQHNGIAATQGRLSPAALTLGRRVNLASSPLMREGVVEVQDEASQLVAFAMNPAPQWRILDACAGAGGKALHIADLQKDAGEIIACDVEYRRLREIPRRAQRAGIRSIRTVLLDSRGGVSAKLPQSLLPWREACDAVLVDAPCSGMGTARRSPMTKWRLQPALLRKLADRQLTLLQAYAQCVKPGGLLLYATCSLMPQENEMLLQRFLAGNDSFQADPLAPALARADIVIDELAEDVGWITLSPENYGSDGFFIARLRRGSQED